MMQTHSQKLLTQAITLITAVRDASSKEVQASYGRLCYDFPVMVMTAGLAQSVAYYQSKATAKDVSHPSAQNQAYGLFLAHMAKVSDHKDLYTYVHTAGLGDYMLTTQRLLDAGVFFKHLAASVLRVESGAEESEEGQV